MPLAVVIKFDNPRVGRLFLMQQGLEVADLVQIEAVASRFKAGKGGFIELQRIQFPLTLAWA